MDRNTLEWYDLLARGLLWAGAIVLLLSVIGAVIIAGSENAIGIAPEAEEQGRGFIALVSLGGGIAAAGVLAGMGALLRMGVAERLERLPAKPKEPEERKERKEAAPSKPEPKPRKAAAKRKKPAAKSDAPVPKLEDEPRRRRRSRAADDEGSKSGE